MLQIELAHGDQRVPSIDDMRLPEGAFKDVDLFSVKDRFDLLFSNHVLDTPISALALSAAITCKLINLGFDL